MTDDAKAPGHFCVECNEEVTASADDECPTCGDETVPMVGWWEWRKVTEGLARLREALAKCVESTVSVGPWGNDGGTETAAVCGHCEGEVTGELHTGECPFGKAETLLTKEGTPTDGT